MKRILALLLCLSACLSLGIVAAADTTATDGETVYLYGDVTLDEKIDASDALSVLRYAVGKEELTEIPRKAADVDGDNAANAADALWILKYSVGKETSFPLGLTFTMGEQNQGQEQPDNTTVVDAANSYNGAYVADTSADCSFVMDNTGLAANTIYVLNSSIVKSSDVDFKRMIVSLQGLINRDFGMDEDHTSLVYCLADTSDSLWLRQMMEDGVFKDFSKITINTVDAFYETFATQLRYCGMVVWDPNVWATANVAATICGVEGYLPVLQDSTAYTKLIEMGVREKLSLVDMFTGEGTIPGTTIASTGSAKNDAYRWALEKYFNRCSAYYIAYTLDGAVTIPGTGFTTSYNCLTNHDYLIARRCFFFDLDPYSGEAACDDPDQRIGLDSETLRLILQTRYDRANGEFGMAMGFPPWWAKYTTNYGGGALSAGALEPYYAEIVGCYNLAMEADAAHPCEMTNGSAYYKYVPTVDQYENTQPEEKLTYDSSKYYFTIYVGDYDSSAWMKQYVYEMWLNRGGDRNRGKINLMWSYNPNLAYRIPNVFDYIFTNASSTDYFAAGDSGAGYILHSTMFQGLTFGATGTSRPAENGDGSEKWIQYCQKFYNIFDLDITGFIINSGNAFDKSVMKMYNQISPVGSTYYNGNDDRLSICDGVPYIQCRIGVGKDKPSYLYDWAMNGMKGYHFAAYRTVSWTPTEIKDNVEAYIEYAAGLGKTVEYVDPYNFFDLIRQSGEGVVVQ